MKHFLTDDTALASYLYLQGITIIEGTLENPNHRRRRYFVFREEPRITQLQEEFYGRVSVVVPLDYQEARTHISRFLKVDIENPNDFLK